jgi:hypothetical protein
MKPIRFTALLFVTAFCLALPSFGEEEADQAGEAQSEAPQETEGSAPAAAPSETAPPSESPVLLNPKHNQDVPATDSSEPARLGWGISLVGVTPLLKENSFDARFKAYGLQGLVSYPIGEIHNRLYLHAEGGFGFMFSQIVPAAGVAYNHAFFDFPIRLRLLYPLNDDGVTGEIFVGGVLRFFEYNDNPAILNGPMYRVLSGVFQPDFAVGVAVPFSRNLRGRLLAGFVYLSLGVELTFDKSP